MEGKQYDMEIQYTSHIQEAEERRALQTPMQEMLFQSSRHFGEISINGTEISIGNSEVVC